MRISFWLLNFIPAKSRATLGWGKPAKRRPRALECCASLESLESRVVLTMNTPVSMAVGTVAANVQIADVNGDGKQDVIQLNSSVSAVSVTLGNGDGTFQAPVNSAAGGFGTKMAVGDFNHDGKLDLVTDQGSSIDILKGNGDGSFQLPVPYYVGAVANDIEVGDFNKDGFDDVVTASFEYGGTSQLMLNDGTGAFPITRNLAIGSLGLDVETADLNNDGNLDLIEGDGVSYVGVLMGRGDGTYQTRSTLNLGIVDRTLETADFNQDGTVDIAVTDGTNLSVMVGNGDGTFRAATTYPAIGASDLKIADLNGDGATDIVENNGQVVFGRGDGTFYAPTVYSTVTGTKIALGDFNGDGADDEIAAVPALLGGGVNVALNAANDATLVAGAVGVSVTTSGTATAGTPFAVTVTAVDANGNVVPGFQGTVGINGAPGSQPVSYTFTAADNGTHTIPNAATVFAAGTQSLTVTSPFLASGTATVSVVAAAPAGFTVSSQPTTIAGDSATVTVTAVDAYGNFSANYTGTIHFTSTDAQGILPADYTFTGADGGAHVFSAVLKTAGTQTIKATDVVNGFLGSSTLATTAAPATSFTLSGGGGFVGSSHAVVVTASDAFGNVATGYNSIVHLSSSDTGTAVSPDIALTNGVGTFAVTPTVMGTQTLTATDLASGSIVGSESIVVTPGWGARFVATPLAATVAGQSQGTTITVYDAYGNISTVYTGLIQVATTDPQAPFAYYSFTAADAGVKVIPITLKTAGSQAVTISDYYNPLVSVTQAGIQVAPAAAASIGVTAVHSVTAGVAQSFTVTAKDAYGNAATSYTGTLSFSSSDAQATLPAAYTFTAADAGVHTFSMTFKTSGGQSLTVTDAAKSTNPAFTVLQSDIPISASAVVGFSFRAPSNVTVGVPFNMTVSAVDAYGNAVTGYTGKVHFSGPSGSGSVLPADYTFTGADQGSHVFSVTLGSTGTQTIGVQDTLDGSLKGQTSVKVVSSSTSGGGSTGGGGGGGTSTGGGGSGGGGGGGGKKVV